MRSATAARACVIGNHNFIYNKEKERSVIKVSTLSLLGYY